MTGRSTGDLLVAYDGTDASRRAAEFAADRATQTDEAVDVVHVGSDLSEREIRDRLADTLIDHRIVGRIETLRTDGGNVNQRSVSEALSDFVRANDYEILYMGNENHSLYEKLRRASVSNDLIDDRLIPIMLVP